MFDNPRWGDDPRDRNNDIRDHNRDRDRDRDDEWHQPGRHRGLGNGDDHRPDGREDPCRRRADRGRGPAGRDRGLPTVKRQYATFAGIANGGEKCNTFFAKVIRRGYAVASDGVHNRAQLFHVHHKPLYHAIGEPESRYRRPVPARRAAERLMLLDAVLASPDLDWFTTASEKVAYLTAVDPPEPVEPSADETIDAEQKAVELSAEETIDAEQKAAAAFPAPCPSVCHASGSRGGATPASTSAGAVRAGSKAIESVRRAGRADGTLVPNLTERTS